MTEHKAKVTNLPMRKLNGVTRKSMSRFLSGVIPLYIVNEYPKSGGTWAGQMLGRALDVPFPRNQFPVLRPSIMHSHLLKPWGLKNATVVWRDGRDVMVSWYYHSLFTNEIDNAHLVKEVRGDLPFEDYEDTEENLPAFIEYAFTRQKHPRFSWADFVRNWRSEGSAVHVWYEGLHEDAAGELQRAVLELTGDELDSDKASTIVEEFSFARRAARNPGEENKGRWMRKGVVGDWRNHFSREAREVFDHYAGQELISLGYEKDRSWIGE